MLLAARTEHSSDPERDLLQHHRKLKSDLHGIFHKQPDHNSPSSPPEAVAKPPPTTPTILQVYTPHHKTERQTGPAHGKQVIRCPQPTRSASFHQKAGHKQQDGPQHRFGTILQQHC